MSGDTVCIGPNPRMAGLYAQMEKRNPAKLEAMRERAAWLREQLANGARI